ncbi:high affinity immunoglobulin gamma Fc receptor I-like [Amphiprion ocellaris]|uniref:Ig-like domain-containing protein n=1 Tax=Amphiprion ocellaris TaxID=80972 RepID=A0A3Q1CCQ4_AMPOC|nr:high affinity immunoglobulin gamma Fc receptor I-like [Amphiprion ocellaris]
MNTVASLLVLLILPQLVVPEAPTVPFRAVVEIVGDNSRIFTGESVRLRCSIPEGSRSGWKFLWFRGGDELRQTDGEFSLWNAKVQQSGKFSCQGVRDTAVGNIHTVRSLPVEINVDGGWAILQVSPHPGIVGDTLNMTCRIRGDRPANNMILYRDSVEVIRQNGNKSHFYLTNLTLEDQGMYSCRASWNIRRRTHSVVSVARYVQVLEVLSQPVLEIIADNDLKRLNKIKLLCHVDYNARGFTPPIHYYFYKDNNQLGTATSEGRDLVSRTPGMYSCKVRVPELGLLRWSEAKSFGKIAGPQIMVPPRPRYLQPLAPPVLSPGRPVPPAAQPTVAQLPSPLITQRTEESIQSSEHPPKPSQPVPTTLPTILRSANHTAAFLPPAAQPTTAHRSTPTPTFIQPTEESIHSSERPLQFFSHTTPGPANATQDHLSGGSDDTFDESSGVAEISAESVTLK